MSSGKVEAIYIAPQRGDPTVRVEHAHLVPGMGIEGDRHFGRAKLKDPGVKPGRELTLIEIEAIDAMQRDGISLTPAQTRRNIITRGISLNALVGHRFKIGDLKLRGVRLCEPCDYLANRTDLRVLQSMAHRGGLRAEIISDGVIYINDMITVSD